MAIPNETWSLEAAAVESLTVFIAACEFLVGCFRDAGGYASGYVTGSGRTASNQGSENPQDARVRRSCLQMGREQTL